jgi:hypothetical protein
MDTLFSFFPIILNLNTIFSEEIYTSICFSIFIIIIYLINICLNIKLNVVYFLLNIFSTIFLKYEISFLITLINLFWLYHSEINYVLISRHNLILHQLGIFIILSFYYIFNTYTFILVLILLNIIIILFNLNLSLPTCLNLFWINCLLIIFINNKVNSYYLDLSYIFLILNYISTKKFTIGNDKMTLSLVLLLLILPFLNTILSINLIAKLIINIFINILLNTIPIFLSDFLYDMFKSIIIIYMIIIQIVNIIKQLISI